ncbi:DNA polymerase I [Belnapia moabensis]|uniref:DNA polymerase I n=1 Tax=Belnapia moabensis TaxID=365533 RepID=UPI0009FBB183|nr:DNA polymerase I [Belnapia moabensis]
MATTITEGAAVPVAAPGTRHLVLVDGSGYIFRAYHALPPMTRPDGTPVNAVFGFTQMLSSFLAEHRGSHLAVVFDASRSTFRNEIFPNYKAHRPEPPEELVPQFALIREATEAFGVAQVEAPGFEADDLIAAYARAFREAGGEVTIVSSDKDLMQLVRPGVQMLDPIKRKPIREAEVVEKFGVPPEKVIEVQALIGDPVDNVPGVPKIGPKTAAELILAYGDLESVLANTAQIKQPMRRQNLEQYAEQARLSKRLVTLDDQAPLTVPIEALAVRPPEPAALSKFLADQGFRSVIARMGLGEAAGDAATRARNSAISAAQAAAAAPAAPADPGATPFGPYETVTTPETLAAWIAEARTAGVIGLDTETDSLDALKANLVGVCLATAPGRACYIPLRHVSAGAGQGDMLATEPEKAAPPQLSFTEAMAALKPLLEDPSVLKVLQHAKYDLEVLGRAENGGIAVAPIDDTMLISYAMEAGKHGHGMDELSRLHLDHTPVPYDQVTGTGRARISFAAVPLDKATAYAAEDADVTLRLWHVLRPRLREDGSLALYEQVERRMVAVLRDMEVEGIKVDGVELARIGEDFVARMAVLDQEIHGLAGRPFAVGSPKQLGEILFDEMKLPGGRKGKSGAWGTDAAVLEDLAAQGIPLARKVLDWRQLSKLKSTYVDGLTAQLDPRTGRVHTDFSMANTSTGRLASTEPNLQNIPVRTEEGQRIRRAFVADPGHVLMSADYSQIELRLLAHMADVPALREAFETGQDIHSRTAADIFRLAPEAVDREARRRAKTINFGIIYGMSAFGLAGRLGIGAGEAKGIIDAYFGQYPGIRAAMERLKEEARLRGYVSTSFGRKLWIQDIGTKDPVRRAGAERAAINAPFQGGAAEIIKRAMVRLPRALREAGLKARLLLQVHDELVLEVPEAEVEATEALVRQVMEGVATLRVPLAVEVGTGRSWAEAH